MPLGGIAISRHPRFPLHPLMFRRRRSVVHDEVHYPVRADVPQSRAKDHRKNPVLAYRVMQRRDQIFFGNRSLLEELLHQFVVALRHQFDQLFVCFLRLRSHIGRDLRLLALAAPSQFVRVGLHAHQVDHAAQILLAPDRQLNRNHIPPERMDQRLQHALRIRPVAVHAVHHNQPRRLVLFAIVPHPLCHYFHAGHAVHHHDRRIHHRQHQLGLVDKHVEPGRIDHVDLRLAPLHVCRGCRNRHFARDLFFVVIGHRRAVVHASQPRRRPGRVQHGRQERGLSRMPVPHDRYITNVFSGINFHE